MLLKQEQNIMLVSIMHTLWKSNRYRHF